MIEDFVSNLLGGAKRYSSKKRSAKKSAKRRSAKKSAKRSAKKSSTKKYLNPATGKYTLKKKAPLSAYA